MATEKKILQRQI